MNTPALLIIDAQRGFMLAEEGERLNAPGFGELAVPAGDAIVPRINQLTQTFLTYELPVYATQDWHPYNTAHFSDAPDFVRSWPRHCVADTDGAKLHPQLIAAQINSVGVEQFIKGDVEAKTPEEDNSYTGFLAHTVEGIPLPDVLKKRRVAALYVVGLALGDGAENPLCVDSTARDFNNDEFEVTVITDADEAVLPHNRDICFENLGKMGVRLMNTAEALAEIAALRKG